MTDPRRPAQTSSTTAPAPAEPAPDAAKPFDPDNPFEGWENASTARRVELLYEVVRRQHDRSRPG